MNTERFEHDELSQGLHRHAEQVDVTRAPSLQHVKSRAGAIRRRRRLVTASVAVAALAVATPLAWSLGQQQRADDLAPVAPTPSQVSTPEQTATPQGPDAATQQNMDLRGIPTSSSAGVGWLDMSGAAFTVHPATGDSFQVEVPDNEWVDGYAPLEDGRWVALTTGGKVLVWDQNGLITHQEFSAFGSMAVDRAHRNVAWVNDQGAPRVLVSGESQPRTLSTEAGELAGAVAIESSKADCTPAQGEEPTCSVLFNSSQQGPVRVYGNGRTEPVAGGTLNENSLGFLDDVHTDDNGVSGDEAGRDATTGCGVLQPLASEPAQPDCSVIYGSFSPDGKRITVISDSPDRSESDAGTSRIGVFPLGRTSMTWYRSPDDTEPDPQATVRDAQWINDTDLAAVVFQDGAWSLVRFDAQGNATQMAPPAPSEALVPLYALETQP